ncbi:MAG: PQQ-dependent sugar dehydrogenase, partial [Chloroflexota bacterium]|nr:PQQ-dependent sugar dehydrogenase [Chloroflexota bacterium]
MKQGSKEEVVSLRFFPFALRLALLAWAGAACVLQACVPARVVRDSRPPPSALVIRPVLMASGFEMPIGIEVSGLPQDDRMFVVEQAGVIRIAQADGTLTEPAFLDIRDRVSVDDWEQGLLGLAFHPNYRENGYFYVNYTDNQGDTHVSRFHVRPDDPDQADPWSEFTLLYIPQPESNHNGGALAFGPDGYLYVALGDGGAYGSYFNAQDGTSLLGKVLRLDVDGIPPYTVPLDNPYVDDPTVLDEVWLMGLRNPWRMSFDRHTGDLFIGDVGLGEWEEINLHPRDSAGGENYGWPCYEGTRPFFSTNCGPREGYRFPIYQYPHDRHCAVIGGYVYRGDAYPMLRGHYLFADLCSGHLWGLSRVGRQGWQASLMSIAPVTWTSFGEDSDGE